jgi:transcriptional regulator of acetoin/glycerol metabolism
VKTKTDKRGQVIAQDLMPLTPMEEAEKTVLTREYHKAKGNISLTSRLVGWSRTKTLNMLKTWNLYELYKHDPWPVERGGK